MTTTLLPTHATPQAKLKPSITIVVSSRDCFSYTQQSLDSIYKHTNVPFELVYVDAGSPKHIQKYLTRAAAKLGFTVVRSDHFLTPNQSRNLGLSQVTTDYVVFMDNDIHVSSGWLEKLWQCAQETDATVVCPLTCIGSSPLHDRIHIAGGEARIFMDVKDNQIRRRLYEKRFLANRSAKSIKHQLYRRACEFAELHCILIKRDVFDQIGYLDERLLSTQEDMDFCLTINRIGGRMFCETSSVVTYVPQAPRHWSDLAYFMLRWSDAWEVESLMHFQQKWDLDMDQYFLQRYKQLGYRRRQVFLYPLLRQLMRKNTALWLEKLTIDLERRLNQIITDRHAQLMNDTIRKFVPTRVPANRQSSIRQRLQRLIRRNASAQISPTHLMSH
ncbi:glycosyltransferase family 2 protein [Leptothoe spongobia]|uniref:Glycosyltransferase family 2 protein n=1 Tax=Leptothoe spongobia TAU-MAC 1115 TaxID=1967444 RepID=A0A947DFB9_9CYAN|nr:glycosyltransferase [Leptothoe spongobia]MBT9315528.1 glycosyltransferase family 2 protein [Leptothoe spongobia TAU-MAC 1115]